MFLQLYKEEEAGSMDSEFPVTIQNLKWEGAMFSSIYCTEVGGVSTVVSIKSNFLS
jgi:hypothetical protein